MIKIGVNGLSDKLQKKSDRDKLLKYIDDLEKKHAYDIGEPGYKFKHEWTKYGQTGDINIGPNPLIKQKMEARRTNLYIAPPKTLDKSAYRSSDITKNGGDIIKKGAKSDIPKAKAKKKKLTLADAKKAAIKRLKKLFGR